MKRLLIAITLLGAVTAQATETYWLSRTGHNNDSVPGAGTGGIPINTNNGPAFTNNVFWMTWDGSVTNAPGLLDSTADYAIYDRSSSKTYKAKYASTLRTHGAKDGNVVDSIFRGRSLKLTGYSTDSGAQIYCYCISPRAIRFENEGLVLDHGGLELMIENASYDIYGKVKVTAKTKGYAYVFAYKERSGQSITFHDAFSGEADAQFSVGSGGPALTCRLLDISNYAGTISVSSGFTLAIAADTPSAASIVLAADSRLTTATATDVTTVANLSLADGAILKPLTAKPAEGGVTNGEIRVTGTLAMDGRVRIPFDYSSLSTDGMTNRFAILTVPLATDLDIGNFDLEISRTGYPADAPLFGGLVVETNATTKTLALVCEPMVWLTTGDNDKQTGSKTATSAFAEGRETSWSDGRLPHEGAHYVVGKADNAAMYLNSLGVGKSDKSDPAVSQTFPGESLTMCSNAVLTIYASPTFAVRKLVLLGGSALRNGQYTGTEGVRIEGEQIVMPSGIVNVNIYTSCNMTFASTLSGTALVKVHGIGGTSSPEGFLTLAKENPDFTGKFSLSSGVTPNLSSINQTIYFAQAQALGGDRPAGTYDAISLTRMAKLYPTASMSIPASRNLGIIVRGSEYYGRIFLSKGKTFRFGSQLTMDGHLRKEGLGQLALGGALAFGSTGEETQPIALSNRLDVVAGSLGVFGAGSVDGLEIAFSNNTALVLMPDFTNAELTRDGIRNVKTDTPFVLAPGMTTLPLSFDFQASVTPPTAVRQGVLTVSANAASAVRGMLPQAPALPWPHYRANWVETTDAETGNVTFALDIAVSGFMMILR